VIVCQLTDLHVRPRGMLSNRVVDTNRFVERAFRAVAAMTPRPEAKDAGARRAVAQGGHATHVAVTETPRLAAISVGISTVVPRSLFIS
jgi:hypothetical protein